MVGWMVGWLDEMGLKPTQPPTGDPALAELGNNTINTKGSMRKCSLKYVVYFTLYTFFRKDQVVVQYLLL